MDICESPGHIDSEGKPLSLTTDARFTHVSHDDRYFETMVGTIYKMNDRFKMGTRIPVVSVQQAGQNTTGLGNVVVFGTASLLNAETNKRLNLGIQLEVPSVSDEALGDGHFLILPTVQFGWYPSNAILSAIVGWGQVLDGNHNHSESHHSSGHDDHGHGHHEAVQAPSIVNPHANTEVLIRTDSGYGWDLSKSRFTTSLRTDIIQEFGDNTNELLASAGPVFGLAWTQITSEISTLFSLTNARRYQHRTTLRLRFQLP